MMKKCLCLLLSLLMFIPASLAEPAAEESAPLTREELEMYLSSLAEEALLDDALGVLEGEGGASVVQYTGGTLEIADEDLSPETAVLGARLAEDQEDPRGLRLGDSLDALLSAYPNDNPRLYGSYYDAALFLAGEKPEISLGYALRDGQRVTQVTYLVLSWLPEGVIRCGVEYRLRQGMIDDIRVFGMQDIITEEEAGEICVSVSCMQEISEYFAYPQDADGQALAPFSREDLSFAGIDFLDLTAEAAFSAFGPAPVDEWTEDSTGEALRLLQWDGVTILLLYDAQRNFLRADSMTVNDDVLEGPRGVRIGDYLESVLFRFRHMDTFSDDSTLLLYGDGEQAPYGVLSYSPEGTEITYALALEDGRAALWHMTFVNAQLQSMRLLLR